MKRLAVFCCVVLLAPVTASAGMKVESRTWDAVNLARYGTYTWRPADDAKTGALIAEGTKLAATLEAIGDQILAKAGLAKSSDGEPGLVMRYRGMSADMLSIEGTTWEISDHVSWIGDPNAHSMTTYRKGALLVEVLDPETEDLLWAGWAIDVLELIPDRKKVAKKAEKAMTKILKEFPVR